VFRVPGKPGQPFSLPRDHFFAFRAFFKAIRTFFTSVSLIDK
jgi:hypothetical protein